VKVIYELTITGFLETMAAIAMRCVDGDFVSAFLEANRGINDQSLGTANAEIGVEEDYVFRLRVCHRCGKTSAIPER
jgi:hypothetical protein